MDLELVKGLMQSAGWDELVKEIDKHIGIELQKLKRCDLDDVITIQARIYALEMLKKLPQDIIEREG
jgi:hypothetical protein